MYQRTERVKPEKVITIYRGKETVSVRVETV